MKESSHKKNSTDFLIKKIALLQKAFKYVEFQKYPLKENAFQKHVELPSNIRSNNIKDCTIVQNPLTAIRQ